MISLHTYASMIVSELEALSVRRAEDASLTRSEDVDPLFELMPSAVAKSTDTVACQDGAENLTTCGLPISAPCQLTT